MDEDVFNVSSNYLTDETPIKTTGTTCDTFMARWNNRRVFIKRLKKEYSTHPLYRKAFQKEYEIGVSLKHQSLPLYLNISGDAILLEYVDGKTLHEMLEENDSWLHIDKNINKLINQLLNVLDYLHARNIIHCDIKEDNLMITNDTRNLVILDLDKCYTSGLDNTHGTPSNFAANNEHITMLQMDIRGVGRIAKKLLSYVRSENLVHRLTELIAATNIPNVTVPELLELWNNAEITENKSIENKKDKKKLIGWGIGCLIFVSLFVVIWSMWQENPTTEEIPVLSLENVDVAEELNSPLQPEVRVEDITENHSKPIQENLDNYIKDDLKAMNHLLDEIDTKLNAGTLPADSVFDIVMSINTLMTDFNNEIIAKYEKYFPGLGKDEIMIAVYKSKYVKEIVSRRDSILQQLIDLQQKKLMSVNNLY